MRWSDPITSTPRGYKTSNGTRRLVGISCPGGASAPDMSGPVPVALTNTLSPDSLDGEVKLWDIRGGDSAMQTWDMFPHGLSAFDVHEQTEVFAAYVIIRVRPLAPF